MEIPLSNSYNELKNLVVFQLKSFSGKYLNFSINSNNLSLYNSEKGINTLIIKRQDDNKIISSQTIYFTEFQITNYSYYEGELSEYPLWITVNTECIPSDLNIENINYTIKKINKEEMKFDFGNQSCSTVNISYSSTLFSFNFYKNYKFFIECNDIFDYSEKVYKALCDYNLDVEPEIKITKIILKKNKTNLELYEKYS